MTVESREDRKARGAFFTPNALCDYIATWTIRTPFDRVLEPSCGDAAFLLAAGERLRTLGASMSPPRVIGVDVDVRSLTQARQRLDAARIPARLVADNFFNFAPRNRFDAVVGNPPYIRFHHFNGEMRATAQEAALRQGVALSPLASSWCAFVIHATSLLRPEGRLGLVLPAEFLHANYAAPVRAFLLNRFQSVRLVMFEERVFPDVTTEVLLVLAEGSGPTDHFDVMSIQNLSDLPNLTAPPAMWNAEIPNESWARALIEPSASELHSTVAGNPAFFTPLRAWGDPTLGMVTGNNKWFTLTRSQVRALTLPPDELVHISPPGSKHLRRLALDTAYWEHLADEEHAAYLFRPSSDALSPGAAKYIRSGERAGVHHAYKCRVRSPWWRVPLVETPDLLLTYMNTEAPRLIANIARVRHVNSVHGIVLKAEARSMGMSLLPLAMLNSASLLGAELIGRSYGGGILKVEPSEADRLPVPSQSLLGVGRKSLERMRTEADNLLRHGRLSEAVDMVDEVLLGSCIGLSRRDIEMLSGARKRLRDRRITRSGRQNPPISSSGSGISS